MKKKWKIFITVFLIIVIPVAALAVWQRENISSYIYSVKYSKEDLSKMLDKNKDELNSAVSGVSGTTPRELEQDEIAALGKGEISENDAVEISLGLTTLHEKIEQIKEENAASKNTDNTSYETEGGNSVNADSKNNADNRASLPNKGNSEEGTTNTDKSENQQTQGGTNNSQTENKLENESASSVLIAKLYVLKASYVAKLDALEGEGIAEYENTPNKNTSWKAAMISKYSGKVAALEGECDAKFEAIVSELKTELEKNGEDTSIIKTIRSAYEKEKQIKKANYLNTYMD